MTQYVAGAALCGRLGRRLSTPRSIVAAAALALLACGCPSGPEPGPEPARTPDPLQDLVSLLGQNARAGRTPDPDAVLSRLRAVAGQDPDPLLSALEGTPIVLDNRQWAASAEVLARAGEGPPQGADLPILQEIFLDAGNGMFRLLYLLRLRPAGNFQANPKDVFSGSGRRGGDVVALSGRILESEHFRDRDLIDVGRAEARLASPDWRVGRTASAALVPEGSGAPEWLMRRAARLLLGSPRLAKRDERARALLYLQGLEDLPLSAAEKEGQAEGVRIAAGYLDWFRDPASGDAWSRELDAFLRGVSEAGRAAADRVERFASGLAEFGHGSELPRKFTELDHPRSYVKVLSPRLQDWCAGMFEGRHADAPLVAVAIAAGADAFLRAQFMEQGREGFLRALVPGLALAPPWIALRAVGWLENTTGSVFLHFDPFGSAESRAAAAKAMAERFEATGFRERGGEAEKTAKVAAARRALESLALMQRKAHAERGAWAANLGEALETGLGNLEAAEAAGFLRDGAGRWSLRAGFALEMTLAGEGFRILARGTVWENEPETVLRYDSAVGMVEILP